MKFSYKWLQSYFKKKLPTPDKLAEVLTMHSFEVEGVEKVEQDWVLDVSVTPNRAADSFSHLGLAQEIGIILGFEGDIPLSKLKEEPDLKVSDFINVQVENSEDCPRYTARLLTDIKIGPSPKWIQERLEACGLRPISNVVDATNYVMLETGQPLHAFDLNKISGVQIPNSKSPIRNKSQISNPKLKTIIVRRAKRGEKIITLDNEKYNLNKNVLLIVDEGGPLAIAGVKGGKKAEIGPTTKTIILESANFNPHLIRQASRDLKIKTDASLRFEHGLDPNATRPAIDMVAALIQEITGAKLAKGVADVYLKKVYPKRVKLGLDYVGKLLGIKMTSQKVKDIIKRLLCLKIKEQKPQYVVVEVLTQRPDITLPEDLIEEIGRIYGYGKIPAIFPRSILVPPEVNENLAYQHKVSDILASLGFTQSLNYSFIGEQDVSILSKAKRNLVSLLNPVSEDKKYLRPSLLINLLKNVKENLKYFEQIRLFEAGKIFKKTKKGLKEKSMLAGAVSRTGGGEELFYELKGTIDALLDQLGIGGVWYDDYQPTPEDTSSALWRQGHCAEIKLDSEEIGFLGQINPQILSKFSVGESVFAFEIDWGKLVNLASEERLYRPPSRFPALSRDIAVLVNLDDKVEKVLNVIEKEGGPLLIDVDLFDFYMGEGIEGGRKSLAFHLVFQSAERSLSDKEVNVIQDKIIKALEERGWRVRQ